MYQNMIDIVGGRRQITGLDFAMVNHTARTLARQVCHQQNYSRIHQSFLASPFSHQKKFLSI